MRKSTGPSKPLAWPGKVPAAESVPSQATKQCPHCAAAIAVDATSCSHCGKDLPATPAPKKDAWEGYDF
jgi:zinc-ribbon domain